MGAMRPQRVTSLILYGTFAVWPTAAPGDCSAETVERSEVHELLEATEHWGEVGKLMEIFAPSVTLTEQQKRAFGIFARAAASPRMARALVETWMKIDIRDILPSVRVPTLVLHVDGNRVVPVEAGQRLADGIPGARLVKYPGGDHNFWVRGSDAIVDEVEWFVTGAIQHAEPNRVLASVLFTDIVASTTRGGAGRPRVARSARAPRRAPRACRLRTADGS